MHWWKEGFPTSASRMMSRKLPYTAALIPLEGRIPNKAISPAEYLINKAADIIGKSKRPVIISVDLEH